MTPGPAYSMTVDRGALTTALDNPQFMEAASGGASLGGALTKALHGVKSTKSLGDGFSEYSKATEAAIPTF